MALVLIRIPDCQYMKWKGSFFNKFNGEWTSFYLTCSTTGYDRASDSDLVIFIRLHWHANFRIPSHWNIWHGICWKQTEKFRLWSFFIINKLDKKWEKCYGAYSKKMITFDVYIRLAIFEFSTLPFTRSLNFKRIRITSQIGIFTSKKLPSKRWNQDILS